jgi:hypothetical protein
MFGVTRGYKDGLQLESLADGNWLVKQNQPVSKIETKSDKLEEYPVTFAGRSITRSKGGKTEEPMRSMQQCMPNKKRKRQHIPLVCPPPEEFLPANNLPGSPSEQNTEISWGGGTPDSKMRGTPVSTP